MCYTSYVIKFSFHFLITGVYCVHKLRSFQI
nr:MAG TPA: hypothetical protein [Bacteriophage sp.]